MSIIDCSGVLKGILPVILFMLQKLGISCTQQKCLFSSVTVKVVQITYLFPPGLHLEGPFISKEKKGAHPKDLIRQFDRGFQDVLDMYGSLNNVSILTLAPELEHATEVIHELTRRGVKVSLGKNQSVCEFGAKTSSQFQDGLELAYVSQTLSSQIHDSFGIFCQK
jgi:hypothetical protein